ncbi:MAG: tripartite tricarboxylate transporter TctB family protein [Geminicoccaceae bacterium]
MEGPGREPLADILFAVAVLALAGIVWWGTASLPPPRYEPLGSAALPRTLAVVMALLGLVLLGRAWAGRRQAAPAAVGLGFRPRPWLAVGVLAVLVLYVAAMDLRLLGFVPASILALVLIGAMLTGFDRRRLPWLAGFVVILVIGVQLLFTRVFYIDLP